MKILNNQIPGLEVKIYRSDNDEFKRTEGSVALPAWKHYFNRRAGGEAPGGTVQLNIGGDSVIDNPAITQDHISAYYYLTAHQEALKEKMLASLLARYNDWQAAYGYDPEDAAALMPDVTDISGFQSLIWLSTVHLLNVSKDGTAYVGYELGCTWEDEHGLGFMTHRDRIIEMGSADTSFLSWVAEKDVEQE